MEPIGVQLFLLGHLQDVWLIFCQGSAHFYGEFIQVREFLGCFFLFSFRCYSNWCYTFNIGCMRSLFSNSNCKCISLSARRRKCLWCSNPNSPLVTWRPNPINSPLWWSHGHGRHRLFLWEMEIDGIFMASSFAIRNGSKSRRVGRRDPMLTQFWKATQDLTATNLFGSPKILQTFMLSTLVNWARVKHGNWLYTAPCGLRAYFERLSDFHYVTRNPNKFVQSMDLMACWKSKWLNCFPNK